MIGRAVVITFYFFCLLFIGTVLTLLWLTGCSNAAAATGPDPDAAVIGDWAAKWPDTVEPAGLILMALDPDKTYAVKVEANTTPVEIESGKWVYRGGRIVFTP